MKMHKHSIIYTSIAVLLIIVLSLYISYENRQRHFLAQRHHIFCELLKFGMKEQAVIETLEQFGNFIYSRDSIEKNNFNIFGGYMDNQIVGSESFYLMFRDGKYINVWINSGFDTRKILCSGENWPLPTEWFLPTP